MELPEEHLAVLIFGAIAVALLLLYFICDFFPITPREVDIYLDRHIHSPMQGFFRELMTDEIRFSMACFLTLVSAASLYFAFTQIDGGFVMNTSMMVPGFAASILSAIMTYDRSIAFSRRVSRCVFVTGLMLLALGIASMHIKDYHRGTLPAALGTAVLLLTCILHVFALVHSQVMTFIARSGTDMLVSS